MTGLIYGEMSLHYNYLKTQEDYFSDLILALDTLPASAKQRISLEEIKEQTLMFINEQITAEHYKTACLKLLENARIHDEKINRSINYIVMKDYFKSLELAIATHVRPGNILHANLLDLKINLYEMLAAEIDSGKAVDTISQSPAIHIAQHTSVFINNIYAEPSHTENIVQAVDQYTNDSIRWGRNWSLGSKIISGVLMCIAATAVCCITAALVGALVALYVADIAVAAYVALLWGSIGAASGTLLGASLGIYGANHFFKLSPTEKKIQALANTVQENMINNSSETEESLEDGCFQAGMECF